jgi:hypothetical protein
MDKLMSGQLRFAFVMLQSPGGTSSSPRISLVLTPPEIAAPLKESL